MYSGACSSTVRLNIGGKKFCTTVDTLTHREPHSMFAAMFSGRHTVRKDSEKDYVFIDRDGKHFRHILNWLRDGASYFPNLSDLERLELLHEAEYYQLLGLVDKINEVLNKKVEVEQMETDLTRNDIIKCVQHAYAVGGRVNLIGLNLSGLDLSKLMADLSYANFEGANLEGANLKGANLTGTHFYGANLQRTDLPLVKDYVFIDRDGKHFRHILNWLRDGVSYIPNLSDLERLELLHEAEYYQLLLAVGGYLRLTGVNLSGLDLSKLL